jgi:nucleoside-diphosphate-sugar epimerase
MTHLANPRRVVLVTGGSGFVGRHALPFLKTDFDEVHATYCSAEPRNLCDQSIWHPIDLLCASSVRSLIAEVRPTHLLHLAWCTEHGRFWSDLANTRWLDASIELARAFAEGGGQRIVTAGTCAEYDGSVGYCREHQTPCAPSSLYGVCKHALQLAMESIAELSVAHGRLFHLFGPGEDERRLVPSVIRSLLSGAPVQCTHGNQVRDFMYVKDAAAALGQLLLSNVCGPVNIASGEPLTIRQLVSAIAEKMGQPEAVHFGGLPQRVGEPQRLTARTSRLHNEVGFQAAYTLEQALEETIADHSKAQPVPSGLAEQPATPACPLCSRENTVPFLKRTGVPVHQNLIHRDSHSARNTMRGTLDMHACHDCGFVFNAAFDPSLLSYGEQYDNTQTCSPAFNEYVNELVRHLLDRRGIRGKHIVEVGCGKGGFLRRLVKDPAAGNQGFGFDPAYVGPDEDFHGRLRFVRQFYDSTATHVPCDAVVSRHVIEHVPAPGAMVATIRSALQQPAADTRVFFETPCVQWILDRGVVWDFFYEHCSLFTAESLRFAFETHGFTTTEVRHIFGGQYLWLEAVPSEQSQNCSAGSVSNDLVRRAIAYGQRESQQLAHWKASIHALASAGGVALWGAGAKGVTFANLVDPQGTIIDCTVDLNPAKQGAFLPGTGTPIIAPESLASRRVANIVVLNPNYLNEIRQRVEELQIAARVIDFGSDLGSQNQDRSLLAA